METLVPNKGMDGYRQPGQIVSSDLREAHLRFATEEGKRKLIHLNMVLVPNTHKYTSTLFTLFMWILQPFLNFNLDLDSETRLKGTMRSQRSEPANTLVREGSPLGTCRGARVHPVHGEDVP